MGIQLTMASKDVKPPYAVEVKILRSKSFYIIYKMLEKGSLLYKKDRTTAGNELGKALATFSKMKDSECLRIISFTKNIFDKRYPETHFTVDYAVKVVPITGNHVDEYDYLWENISQCRSIEALKFRKRTKKTFVGLTSYEGNTVSCLDIEPCACPATNVSEFADLQIDELSNDSLCYDEEKNILFLKEVKQPSDFIADSDLYYGWDLD